MATIGFIVNGVTQSVDTEPQRTLLDVLREDLDLTGTKYGCGEGSCRSCAVLVDGRPLASCQVPIGKVEGKNVVTIEGLENGDELHPVQAAFIAEGAMQCGYCVPGMIVTAVALLQNNPAPSRDQIVEFMDGNLCRCCNYPNIVNAIESAARAMQEVTT
jgi:aerobic-type carbon monoxide dehydrogenase small subunit (CoxS/CutS family)